MPPTAHHGSGRDFHETMRSLVQVVDASAVPEPPPLVKVGVDLGTATAVLVVVDSDDRPLACASEAADIVRDGVVVDFVGAIDVVRRLKARVERRVGARLTSAHGAYPPGVGEGEVRAVRHVIEGADLNCTGLVDEPSAANAVLEVRNAVVVDIGGGTTGVAVFSDGRPVQVADEPTGGLHFSLVIAGGLGVTLEEAEVLKRDPAQHRRLLPMLLPVMEKVASIVVANVRENLVQHVYLVGGSVAFPGMDDVVARVTGLPTTVLPEPMLVTPLGIALSAPVTSTEPLPPA